MDQEKTLRFVDKYGNGNAYLEILEKTYHNKPKPFIKVRQTIVRYNRSFDLFNLPMDVARKVAEIIKMGFAKEEFDEYGDGTTQIDVERYYCCDGWYIKAIRTVYSKSKREELFDMPSKAAEQIADAIIAC